MLSKISWELFLGSLGAALLIYYLVVVVVFYRKDVVNKARREHPGSDVTTRVDPDNTTGL